MPILQDSGQHKSSPSRSTRQGNHHQFIVSCSFETVHDPVSVGRSLAPQFPAAQPLAVPTEVPSTPAFAPYMTAFMLFSRFRSCGAKLFYEQGAKQQATSPARGKAHDARREAFSAHLSTRHHDLCPWRANPCPSDFLQMPVMDQEDLVKGAQLLM